MSIQNPGELRGILLPCSEMKKHGEIARPFTIA